MLSPAQPSPSPSGKKMHHFSLRFSTKILKDCEIMLFQNRKNKIGGSTKFSMKITYFDRKNTLFLIQSWNIFGHVTGNPIWISARHIGRQKLNSHTGVSIFGDRKMMKNHLFWSKKYGVFDPFLEYLWWRDRKSNLDFRAVVTWWFFHVFRVLPDPLQDRRVDFLTLNLDEKSCYFRVFFACFLTHCETEVLIFWRSISTKNRVIFVCFSRAFWPIARPACWFFRVTRSVGF